MKKPFAASNRQLFLLRKFNPLSSEIVPCAVTHKNVTSSVSFNGIPKETDGSNFIFNPKFGYILSQPTKSNDGVYVCQASYAGITETRTVVLEYDGKNLWV